MAEHSGARGTAANAAATANVGGVWGCFQGLASLVRTRSPELLGDQLQHLPAPEVFSTVLDFLPASALATLSISSSWCRRFADAEEVWRQACVKTWATKQHSARMRTWLSESARSSPTPGSSSSSSDSEDTWKARYIFALKDRHRCRILPEELCWDAARDEGGRPLPRRWHLKMHLGRWVDKEVIFSPGGGTFSDFDFRVLNFRVFQEIPWRPHPGEGPDREERGLSDLGEEDEESREEEGSQEDLHVNSESDDGQMSQATNPPPEMDDELQDSDSSHVDMHESEHSHSSVSSIPVLSTPMMEMDALSFRTLERGAGLGRRTRLVASEAAAAAAGLVDGASENGGDGETGDGRRRDLPRPRFLRTLRPPPPPLLHFGRRFADGPFLMPLPLPLAAVPLPTPPVVPRRRHASGCCLLEVPSLPFLLRVGRTPDWGWSLTPVVEGSREQETIAEERPCGLS
ncbi:unnamed protein product [Durusdinium trenchii]|uniref:F-box domain-containing protein n=1 Tax=Durusdinium trenchii TaxID=1381693 RepID=A0ABP0QYR4_9DINO